MFKNTALLALLVTRIRIEMTARQAELGFIFLSRGLQEFSYTCRGFYGEGS